MKKGSLYIYEPYDELTWGPRRNRGGCFGMLLYIVLIIMLFISMFVKFGSR